MCSEGEVAQKKQQHFIIAVSLDDLRLSCTLTSCLYWPQVGDLALRCVITDSDGWAVWNRRPPTHDRCDRQRTNQPTKAACCRLGSFSWRTSQRLGTRTALGVDIYRSKVSVWSGPLIDKPSLSATTCSGHRCGPVTEIYLSGPSWRALPPVTPPPPRPPPSSRPSSVSTSVTTIHSCSLPRLPRCSFGSFTSAGALGAHLMLGETVVCAAVSPRNLYPTG